MPRILVVDDEEVDRELARRCLASQGELKILEARNGEEALKMLSQGPVDLVLTDLRMPKLDGLELVKQLRAADGAPPVILMTSKGSERMAVRALEAGAANYVPKRAMKSELAGVVARVLELEEAHAMRRRAVGCLESREISFSLSNDPALISPLSAWFQDGLEHIGFATRSVRAQIGIALMEAVSNAMIHGNLEVDSDLRRRDLDAWSDLVVKRRAEMPWAARKVRCMAREDPARVEYTVSDEGKGFDTAELPDPTDPEAVLDVAGRGIYLIRTFMDEVRFNDDGTSITMSKHAPDEPPKQA